MIINKYTRKCQSCGIKVETAAGFAYKNGNSWFTVCASTACHRLLGIESQSNQAITQERKLTEDGSIHMPYDIDAIPLLRSMPGTRWNGDNKSWTVSIKPADLPRVIEIADQLQLQIPDSLREKLNAGTVDSQKAMARAEKPRADGKTLYPFQKVGVNFLALHDRALLADEMGTGKTPVSIMSLPENASVIVVCPAAVKYNWRDEINSWRPEFKVTICNGRDSFVFPKPGEITICNYDILPSYLSPTKKSGKVSRKGNEI